MLERSTTAEGVGIYRSRQLSRIGVPHGFTTRNGGLSGGPFASLNLSASVHDGADEAADDPELVRQNLDRARQAIAGDGPRRLVSARQVHGAAVHVVGDGDEDQVAEADALVTDDADVLLCVRVADCLPLLFASRTGGVVAAVHAGWRGLVAGVIPRALEALVDHFDVEPVDLVCAIGPGISAAHYEVGDDVAQAIAQGIGPQVVLHAAGGGTYVDLIAGAMLQLRRAGIADSALDFATSCTYRDAHEFFSHRRDRGVTGRQGALIGVA